MILFLHKKKKFGFGFFFFSYLQRTLYIYTKYNKNEFFFSATQNFLFRGSPNIIFRYAFYVFCILWKKKVFFLFYSFCLKSLQPQKKNLLAFLKGSCKIRFFSFSLLAFYYLFAQNLLNKKNFGHELCKSNILFIEITLIFTLFFGCWSFSYFGLDFFFYKDTYSIMYVELHVE